MQMQIGKESAAIFVEPIQFAKPLDVETPEPDDPDDPPEPTKPDERVPVTAVAAA